MFIALWSNLASLFLNLPIPAAGIEGGEFLEGTASGDNVFMLE
jgi:hypothetical protein